MSPELIRIHDVFGRTSLTSRASAKELTQLVLSTQTDVVVLDFADVEALTRSFMDQFYHERAREMRPKKRVRVKNLCPDVRDSWFSYLRSRRTGRPAPHRGGQIQIVNI